MKHMHCCGFIPPKSIRAKLRKLRPDLGEAIDEQPEAGCGHVWEHDPNEMTLADWVEFEPGERSDHHCPVCKRGPWLLQFERNPVFCKSINIVEESNERSDT